MIPPQDLKNKNFSRTVRGYNPIEVDDYIKFIIGKYEQLCKENAELEKRLHIVSGKYEELANDEQAIRNAVAQARKLSEAMISAAEKKATEIIDKVQRRLDEMIEDAQIKVESEQAKLSDLRLEAARFHQMVMNAYTEQLKTMRQVEIPSPEQVLQEFPAREQIRAEAMDSLIPEEIIERAVVAPAQDPELEEFKHFVRPSRKRLTKEEKEARKKAREAGATLGRLTDEVLQSSVDEEDPSELVSPSELIAQASEMSVEEALLDPEDAPATEACEAEDAAEGTAPDVATDSRNLASTPEQSTASDATDDAEDSSI